MTETTGAQVEPRTVGQVAEQFDVTVRTLHHYDEIGLLVPSERSGAGYRLYTDADVVRLQHVVVYRRLGFGLEEIALLLDHPESAVQHLRRQRAAVMTRLDEMRDLVAAIDKALKREESGMKLTKDEQQELFGEGYSDEYAAEAQERWGDTAAWKQSNERTSRYTKADWEEVKAETDAVNAAFVAAMEAGLPANSEAAMDAAEQHRLLIDTRFYELDHEFHRNVSQLYVTDERFTRNLDKVRPGLAQYQRDAIHANADRHA